jgi:ABC-type transport system substrate-binding protein
VNTTIHDGHWDMYVEDLLSLLTIDSNAFLSTAYVSRNSSAWSHARHTDTNVDDYYARYAREMDVTRRKAIGKDLVEYVADRMYWNTISGSPFYMIAQPRVKGYVYNAEFEVHWDSVWLDK